MSREVLNAVPTAWLLVAAVVLSLGVVLLCVRLVRHFVPGPREGYHAEVSAPMLNVVAAVFGLLLAFVIVIAYQNFLGAQANVSQGGGCARLDRARQRRVPGAGARERAPGRGCLRAGGRQE